MSKKDSGGKVYKLTEGQIRKGGQNAKPSSPRPEIKVSGQGKANKTTKK